MDEQNREPNEQELGDLEVNAEQADGVKGGAINHDATQDLRPIVEKVEPNKPR